MIYSKKHLQLKSGSRIAVIGGGPAGSFFAFFAQKLAREQGVDVQITIYDGKDFLQTGPPGCNLCAGVISETLVAAMQKEGMHLPVQKIRRYIKGYYHEHMLGCSIIDPPRRSCTIYTVFRGNGPRYSSYDGNISFDDFLLQCAAESGVKVVRAHVTDIMLPDDADKPVKFTYAHNGTSMDAEAELIVGAFGLNTRILRKVEKLGFGYRSPKAITSLHAEVPLFDNPLKKSLQDRIGVFSLPELPDLRFGVVTPKGDYLTVSLVGQKNVHNETLQRFLQHPRVRGVFADSSKTPTALCQCRPKIPIGPGKKPFTDRMVIIGDASFSRHFKNGIYSAFITAKLAAMTAFYHGISRKCFYNFYYKPARREIIRDNYVGRFLFFVSHYMARIKPFLSIYNNLLKKRKPTFPGRIIQLFSWNMMTGEMPYKIILQDVIMARHRTILEPDKISQFLDSKLRKDEYVLKRKKKVAASMIKNGDIIAIVGGGPAGVGCALALKNLARQLGKEIRVRLYESKPQDGIPRYNQCVGVLSPPIKEILDELGVDFPYHLVQRTIDGYVLHSDRQSIFLNGKAEPSLAVRRITFDNYLLNEARKKDVEIVESRVTGIEVHDNMVTVYSESDNVRAAAVVGAFGLDDGSTQMFARETNYRPPRFLNSIVTKWHPEHDFIDRFENSIHAFLPANREIEFGAVTPKENHFTINIAGEKVNATLMDWFLHYPPLVKLFPDYFQHQRSELSYFKGKFPISIAKGMFGYRYITVGDAAGLVRPFKGKGINSALLSGMRAARVLLQNGVSEEGFKEYLSLNHEVIEDIPYGKAVRITANLLSNTHLLDYLILLSAKEEPLQKALFNSVSAHKPYKVIVHETLNRKTLLQGLKMLEQLSMKRKRHRR